MNAKAKESADMFVESFKKNPELLDAYKKMTEYNRDVGIVYLYILSALKQRNMTASIPVIKEEILKVITDKQKSYDVGEVIIALMDILSSTISKNMIELAEYIKSQLQG